MFKKFLILFSLTICIPFFAGILLGGEINAEGCDEEKKFSLSFNLLVNTANACRDDVYMGGMWQYNKSITVNYTNIHNPYHERITQAINYYNNFTNGWIGMQSSTSSSADIHIVGVNRPSETWSGKAVGSIRGHIHPKNAINNVERYYEYGGIVIQLNYGKNITNLSTNSQHFLVRHELGHAIGLGHRTSTSHLMYCYITTRTQLSSTELNTLENIYNTSKW
ncbi:matrixin family metalloprotease [Sutcliffiella horikoshii]|uniref:matrixin family metalloprotease n=1 Tax=Sutcliffiella horikoshii TaxID=79883 RepID=UPI00384F075A